MGTEAMNKLMVNIGGYSDAGVRDSNQDAFASKTPSNASDLKHKGIVASLADGVSCSSNAQQASHTSVTQFIDDYYCTPQSWSVKESAAKVLNPLNSWLFQHGKHNDLRHNGFVSTLSSIIFKSTTAHLFHVGDSRIYRFRDGKLQQLTQDHTRAQYGKRHFLVRALGMDSTLDIDYQKIDLKKNDLYLLTSDGVHDWLTIAELTKSLSALTYSSSLSSKQLEASAEQIAKKALTEGSIDNLSALLVHIDEIPNANVSELFYELTQYAVPPALIIGNDIDHFTITKVLYSGPRSHVYLATSHIDHQEYVLKAPSLNFTDDMGYLEGFAKEHWVGRELKHRSIMKIHPRSNNTKFLYHVCDVVKGTTLRQWMYDNQKPSLDTVREIIRNILTAVRVFQRSAMVHRDLKPENIMIADDNEITIIDFGTVQIDGFDEIHSSLTDDIPLGAVNYIAPEYLNGERASSCSDLFSIAVITYELLTGHLPYKTISSQSLSRARHIKWNYRSALEFRKDLPTWIDATLKKACHPSAQCRYEAKSEFITDLCTPNPTLLTELNTAPLIVRNPTRFWQAIAFLFALIAGLELILLTAFIK